MDASINPNPEPQKFKLVTGDYLFIGLMFVVLASVIWIGILSFEEAMKTEESKRNGEELVAWLTETGTKRFEPGFELAACAAGSKPVAEAAAPAPAVVEAVDELALGMAQEHAAQHGEADKDKPVAAAAPAANTWGGCMEKMFELPAFSKMLNPFTKARPRMVPACVPSDGDLPGAISIEKLVATPAGSAVPFINSPLVETDAIGEKMQLRVSICDKGAYAVKVGEFEF